MPDDSPAVATAPLIGGSVAPEPSDLIELVIGRVGRAHGIKGDVFVEVRTDDPAGRFAAGSSVLTQPRARGPLTVQDSRAHSGRLVLRFAGIDDRTAAERLSGTVLVVEVAPNELPDDPDDFYDHHLVGLDVRDRTGRSLGRVTDVAHLPSQDVLAVASGEAEVLVPFVSAIVPEVHVAEGYLVVEPPEGLFAS